MKLPSITNATLTQVTTAGFTANYDQTATAGATKWSGTELVCWTEMIDDRSKGNARLVRSADEIDDVLVRRYLVVDAALPVSFAIGDVVTVTRDGGTETGIVDRITTTEATGFAGVTRLVLRDA